MIDWKIEPQIGVGPLKFGMTPGDVEAVLGPVERSLKIANNFIGLPTLQKKFKNDIAEYRIFGNVTTMKPTISYRSGKLINIGFESIHDTLSIYGMNLFKTSRRKVIDTLSMHCRNVISTNNDYTIYFMEIGINLANVQFSKKEPQISVWMSEIYQDLFDDPDYVYVKRG